MRIAVSHMYDRLNKDTLRAQVTCNICGKQLVKPYLEKHKKDSYANTRKKIICVCDAHVYDLEKHMTKQVHVKNLR